MAVEDVLSLKLVSALPAFVGAGLISTFITFCTGVAPAKADITYTCSSGVAASTCNYLNTTVASYYDDTFSNVNADVYVQYGATGLGSSTSGGYNTVSYSAFVSDLAAEKGLGVVRSEALASLAGPEPSLYGGGDISITGAEGTAFGLTGLNGSTPDGSSCALGPSGCYDGEVTVTNNPSVSLYYRTGGAESPDQYDFYSVVEHETDEVLGTPSCVSTTGATLVNSCAGVAAASAADLFRYNDGNRVFIDSTLGAYFSYDGGLTNGAGSGKFYNTITDSEDYADYVSTCPIKVSVQDGASCPGKSNTNITNDGGAEIRTLDAIGFNLRVTSAAPEPSTWLMMVLGVGLLGGSLRIARRNNASAFAKV